MITQDICNGKTISYMRTFVRESCADWSLEIGFTDGTCFDIGVDTNYRTVTKQYGLNTAQFNNLESIQITTLYLNEDYDSEGVRHYTIR